MLVLNLVRIIIVFLLPFQLQASNTSQQAELLSVYTAIKNQQLPLLQNQPVSIQSNISNNRLSAEVYAVKRYDFSTLVQKLSKPDQWCRFITLHLNIKACIYRLKPESSLSFFAGRKFYEPASDAYELRYRFKPETITENYFKLSLSADEGPFGTSDYLIVLQALKVEKEILISMSLSYQSSFTSRLGARVYLSTIGADKIGFSQQLSADGKQEYIKGIEGIIERNVMRYFIALSTYLDVEDKDQMISQWFKSTEQYAAQLHEVDEKEYLEAKLKEYKQQSLMQQRVNNGQSVFDDLSNF